MKLEPLKKQLRKDLCELQSFIERFNLKHEELIEGITKDKINTGDFNSHFKKNELSQKSLIYMVSFDGLTAEILMKAFKKTKKKSDRKLCRFNENKNDTKCLYIGSKKKDFHLRFKQHLGFGPKGTYALNLAHWLPKNASLTFEVFSIEGFPEIKENQQNGVATKQNLLEFIEQGLWDLNQPLLGKKSGL